MSPLTVFDPAVTVTDSSVPFSTATVTSSAGDTLLVSAAGVMVSLAALTGEPAEPLPLPAPDPLPGAVHLPDALLEQPATAAPAARPTPETRTVRRFSINVPPGEERY